MEIALGNAQHARSDPFDRLGIGRFARLVAKAQTVPAAAARAIAATIRRHFLDDQAAFGELAQMVVKAISRPSHLRGQFGDADEFAKGLQRVDDLDARWRRQQLDLGGILDCTALLLCHWLACLL